MLKRKIDDIVLRKRQKLGDVDVEQLIVINSKDRYFGTPAHFKIRSPMLVEDGYYRASLRSISIPNIVYNVDHDMNETFIIKGRERIVGYISPGNYDVYSILDAVNKAFEDVSINAKLSYNSNNMCYIVEFDEDVEIDGSLFAFLGFGEFCDICFLDESDEKKALKGARRAFQSKPIVDLGERLDYYIDINHLCNSVMRNDQPLSTYQVLKGNGLITETYYTNESQCVEKAECEDAFVEVMLVDQYGKLINLKSDWNMVLCITHID
jgi:hypothetical protein